MKQVIRELRRTATEDWPILAGAFGIWAVLVLLLAAKGVDGLNPGSYRSNLLLYVVTLSVLSLLAGGWALYRAKPNSPIAFLIQLVTRGDVPRRFIRGVPLLAALVVFMPAFSTMKSAIPLFNAHNWDGAFIAADQAIHGGDAWRLLQPVLGFPIVTSALSLMYVVWFFVIYASSIYFCFLARDRELRAQYFIAYFASWTICGVFLATLFASVGPCFVGPLLGDASFDAQMAYLRAADEQIPVMTLQVQQMLLDWHRADADGLGSGITAMPSMHVAIAFLFWLAVRKVPQRGGRWMLTFLVLIWIGSVHLAYHYMVDGLVSIALVALLWWLSRKVLAGWDALLAQAALRTNTVPAE